MNFIAFFSIYCYNVYDKYIGPKLEVLIYIDSVAIGYDQCLATIVSRIELLCLLYKQRINPTAYQCVLVQYQVTLLILLIMLNKQYL